MFPWSVVLATSRRASSRVSPIRCIHRRGPDGSPRFAARRDAGSGSIAPGDDSVEARSRAHCADEQHVAAVVAFEGPVVEADDVHGAERLACPIMSDLTKTCVAAVLLLGLGGCSTAIYGSAPAREGYVY